MKIKLLCATRDYRLHTAETLPHRRFFDEPASPQEWTPRLSHVNDCPAHLVLIAKPAKPVRPIGRPPKVKT